MGCDIHLFVEKRVNGRWVKAEKWSEDEYVLGRNYSLYAILADVRNGTAYYTSDINDRFVPIDMPRGLPEDVSPEIRAKSTKWVYGHSHSHLTVAELIGYNWQQTIKYHRSRPLSWHGIGICGPEMKEIIKGKEWTWVRAKEEFPIEWSQTYYESCPDFVDKTIPRLKELSEGNYEDVRIVFWFDA
jgi:hypothetical protein